MGLFSSKTEGGIMDVIRCDEQEYLVWKWRPSGEANTTKKENSIRWGSSLRIKDGELAVFVYQQKDGTLQDFILGPHDDTIKTANFPVLTNIVGALWGGNSPFQAEIYFINLAGNVQIKFGIPYFDVFDNRFPDLGVPCTVHGTLTFNLTDYKNFIKLNRLINFDLEDLKKQIKDFFIRKTKSVVMNVPEDMNIPVMQMERKIDEISDFIKSKIATVLQDDFGINLKRLDISKIELDKEHEHYQQLKFSTADQQTKNIDELNRIQRKDIEMGVEGKNFAVHQLNQQTDVLKTAAQNLGSMGNTGGDGINPAGMMTGMMMGGAMGGQMAGMMNQNMNQQNQNVQQGSVICPKCNTVNAANTKFCSNCANPLAPQVLQQQEQVCSNCQSKFPSNSKFCPNCGTQAKQEKFCPECGNKVAADAKFCPNCGKGII
jgi:membrane protease subunit (stomatin/prohibitin family)